MGVVEKLVALLEVGKALSTERGVDRLLPLICREATKVCEADRSSCFLVDRERGELWTTVAEGLEGNEIRIPLTAGIAGHVVQTGEVVSIPDAYADPRFNPESDKRTGYRTRNILAAPMRDSAGEVLGVLQVLNKLQGGFTATDAEIVVAMGGQAAIAVENAQLIAALNQYSQRLEQRVSERTQELQAVNQRIHEASREKSRFIANMSHELRAPLNSILGFSDVLIERAFGELNDKQAHYLKNIHESGRHLLQLINDILDISKVEAGKIDLHIESLSLSRVLEDFIMIMRGQAMKKKIALTLEVDPRLRSVRADPVRFKQIMFNLVNNAVKFTPEGGGVTVSARPRADGMVAIAVRDTGIGVAAEDLDKLFAEFVQIHKGAGVTAEGTGLGLALSKRLVELHGGTIWVESPGKDQGSTFTFTLPAAVM